MISMWWLFDLKNGHRAEGEEMASVKMEFYLEYIQDCIAISSRTLNIITLVVWINRAMHTLVFQSKSHHP